MSLLHKDAVDLFKGLHSNHEIITLCVRWYVTYKLRYRDLVEIMAERHVDVSPHYHYAVGTTVRPSIRKTLAALRSIGGYLLAVRRNVHSIQRAMGVPLPCSAVIRSLEMVKSQG
jgi:transposase-like protein